MRYRDSENVFVKSSMQKNKRFLDGRSFPSSTVDANAPSPQHLRLSGFQEPYGDNVTSNRGFVNPLEKRSFIEAPADSDKLRVMHKGVLSGASDLSKRARTFQDLLVKHKSW